MVRFKASNGQQTYYHQQNASNKIVKYLEQKSVIIKKQNKKEEFFKKIKDLVENSDYLINLIKIKLKELKDERGRV